MNVWYKKNSNARRALGFPCLEPFAQFISHVEMQGKKGSRAVQIFGHSYAWLCLVIVGYVWLMFGLSLGHLCKNARGALGFPFLLTHLRTCLLTHSLN